MKKYVVISLLFFLTILACVIPGLVGGNATEVPAQREPTADLALFLAQTQTALAFVLPTNTLAAPIVPTETLELQVTGTAAANLNCRQGPDGNFPLVRLLETGTSAEVIGKNSASGTWVKLDLGDGTECWASAELFSFSGSLESVAVVESPPVPTGFYSAWVGTWTAWQNFCYGGSGASCFNSFPYTLVMTDARTVVGNYSTGGCSFTDIMIISADGMRLDGEEFGCGGLNWEVHLVMDPNLNQFRGRWNDPGDTSSDGYFCGARNGYGKPSPERP